MKAVLIIIISFIIVPLVFAKDISLIEHMVVKQDVTKIKNAAVMASHSDVTHQGNPNIDEEENYFLNEESSRLRDLKLLSLDVERTNLELKKQEMLVKIMSLNNTSPVVMSTDSANEQKNNINIIIHSILISSTDSIAIISVNNVQYTVVPSQILPNGLVVKSILPSNLKVIYPDGSIKDIMYTKG